MSTAARFHLKRASGWFAAGVEVDAALRLLSDATFKLFVWLCLHAERGCGSIVVTTLELARELRRSEAQVEANLQELCQREYVSIGKTLLKSPIGFGLTYALRKEPSPTINGSTSAV